jgi:hypothetical protein
MRVYGSIPPQSPLLRSCLTKSKEESIAMVAKDVKTFFENVTKKHHQEKLTF